MQKLIKYIKAVYANRVTILEAFIAYLKGDIAQRYLAQERLNTCKSCPYYSENTKSRPYGYLPYKHCTECGCFIGLKKYSKVNPSKNPCPNNLWKK